MRYLTIIFLLILAITTACNKGDPDDGDFIDIDEGQSNWINLSLWTNDDIEYTTYEVAAVHVSNDYSFLLLNVRSRFDNIAIRFTSTSKGNIWNEDGFEIGEAADVQFLDDKLAYRLLIGEKTQLEKSKNGGETWNLVDDKYISHIHFVTENLGFAIDGSYAVYKTADGGQSWETFNAGAILDNISFMNEMIGFGTSRGKVYRTVDGGKNWEKVYETFSERLCKVCIATDEIVFTGGDNGSIFKSSDIGDNWERRYNFKESESAVVKNIYFVTRDIGFAAVSNAGEFIHHPNGDDRARGAIIKTVDGGHNWRINYTSNTMRFTGFWFKTDSVGYAFSEYGYDNNRNAYITKTVSQGQ